MFRMVMMVRLMPRGRRMEMVGMVPPEQGRPGLWVEAGGDTRDQHLESDYTVDTQARQLSSHTLCRYLATIYCLSDTIQMVFGLSGQ